MRRSLVITLLVVGVACVAGATTLLVVRANSVGGVYNAYDVEDIVNPQHLKKDMTREERSAYLLQCLKTGIDADFDPQSGSIRHSLVKDQVIRGTVEAGTSPVIFYVMDRGGKHVRDAGMVESGKKYSFAIRAQQTGDYYECYFVCSGDKGGARYLERLK